MLNNHGSCSKDESRGAISALQPGACQKGVACVAISLEKKIGFACITYTLNIIHDHRVITNKHPSITHFKGLLFATWFTFVHSELYILSSHVQHVQNQK